jgi:hypothetical protein
MKINSYSLIIVGCLVLGSPLSRAASGITGASQPLVSVQQSTSDLAKKAKAIQFQSLAFSELRMPELAQFLTQKSQEFDPENRGIKFTFKKEAEPKNTFFGIDLETEATSAISLKMENARLIDVLGYLSEMTKVKFEVGKNEIYLVVPKGTIAKNK